MPLLRALWILLFLSGLAAPLQAQTTNTIEFDYQAISVATVNGYGLGVRVDGVLRSEPITCAAAAANSADTTCRITIPALAAGSHAITILASSGGASSEYTVTGIDPSRAPKNPKTGTPRIIITTTVTITS